MRVRWLCKSGNRPIRRRRVNGFPRVALANELVATLVANRAIPATRGDSPPRSKLLIPRTFGVIRVPLLRSWRSPRSTYSLCGGAYLLRPEAAERHVLARLAEEPSEGPFRDGHRLSPGWHRPDVGTLDLLPDCTFRRREDQLAVCLIDLAESDLQRPSDGRLPKRLRLQSKVCAALFRLGGGSRAWRRRGRRRRSWCGRRGGSGCVGCPCSRCWCRSRMRRHQASLTQCVVQTSVPITVLRDTGTQRDCGPCCV